MSRYNEDTLTIQGCTFCCWIREEQMWRRDHKTIVKKKRRFKKNNRRMVWFQCRRKRKRHHHVIPSILSYIAFSILCTLRVDDVIVTLVSSSPCIIIIYFGFASCLPCHANEMVISFITQFPWRRFLLYTLFRLVIVIWIQTPKYM